MCRSRRVQDGGGGGQAELRDPRVGLGHGLFPSPLSVALQRPWAQPPDAAALRRSKRRPWPSLSAAVLPLLRPDSYWGRSGRRAPFDALWAACALNPAGRASLQGAGMGVCGPSAPVSTEVDNVGPGMS